MEAVLYIGHGSRSTEGNVQFAEFVHLLDERLEGTISQHGFLENAVPSINEAITTCVAQGATMLTVVPVLLLPGVHANEDIPVELEKAKKQYPYLDIRYGRPLGFDELVLDSIVHRLLEKGYQWNHPATVLLVGHGSRDPQGAEEFERIVRSLQERGIPATSAYLKMTEPHFSEKLLTLSKIDEEGPLYVLPHLLLTGGFTAYMENEIAMLRENSNREIIPCQATGFNDNLLSLLYKRVIETKMRQPL